MARPLHTGPVRDHGRWRSCSYVLEREDFNEMRMRLPRAARRHVEEAPDGDVGLVAQALDAGAGGAPLAVLYDHVPASMAEQRMGELGDRLTELFG